MWLNELYNILFLTSLYLATGYQGMSQDIINLKTSKKISFTISLTDVPILTEEEVQFKYQQ